MSAEPANIYQQPLERSLDPEDWERLRELGHQAFDDVIEYLKTSSKASIVYCQLTIWPDTRGPSI